MTGLREHFAELADEAKHYDVADSVIKAARRRQRMARMAPIGVAAAVAVAVLAAWLPLAGGQEGGEAPGIDAAGPAEPAAVDWIPRQWTVPDSAPTLPTDKAVGAAALAYSPCPAVQDNCTKFFLVTRDGNQYSIPGGEVVSLSPDGRWLAYGPEGARTLRDLTGTVTRPLGRVNGFAWSPDGGQLVLEPDTPGANPASVTVMALGSGRTHQVPIHDPDYWAVRGVFPSGELLLAPRRDYDPGADPVGTPPPSLSGPHRPNGQPPGFFVAIADGRTGEQRGVDVPLTDEILTDRDTFGTGPAMPLVISPDGQTLYYQLLRESSGATSVAGGDLLSIAADSGQILERYRLPVAGKATSDRSLATVRADGVLLVAHEGDALTLELLDPVTGRRHAIAQPPAGVRLLLPGTAHWMM